MFGFKYAKEALLCIVAIIASIEAGGWIADATAVGSPWRFLALAPVVIAVALTTWVELRGVGRMDELQRLMYLTATLVGSMAAVLVCSIAYVGEVMQLWPRIAPFWILASLAGGFLAGWAYARHRYS